MTIICFSHLRWNFVYQRPQHLLTRFSKYYTVYFFEEPVFNDEKDKCSIDKNAEGVYVVTPSLNSEKTTISIEERLAALLKKLITEKHISNYIFWYYSPVMFLFSKQFNPSLVIYDCMDELSAFKFAPPQLKDAEQQLFKAADVVFTGGHSLYQAKKNLHHNIYPFPSSIEKEHFVKARFHKAEPADQKNILHPRFGFFGVLDERFDAKLIRKAAAKKTDWQFVFLGPVVKISMNDLPQGDNIHYLGSKTYQELPSYISGWDVALVPFAINESTRYISPTKTPEYLAAGKPVISTAIADVVKPYGEEKLVSIIHSAEEFITAGEDILQQKNKTAWLKKADEFLAENSWDNTYQQMNNIIKKALLKLGNAVNNKQEAYV